jgi:hypothetical protein
LIGKVIFNDFLYHHVNDGLAGAANRTFDLQKGAQLTADQFVHGAKAAQNPSLQLRSVRRDFRVG